MTTVKLADCAVAPLTVAAARSLAPAVPSAESKAAITASADGVPPLPVRVPASRPATKDGRPETPGV